MNSILATARRTVPFVLALTLLPAAGCERGSSATPETGEPSSFGAVTRAGGERVSLSPIETIHRARQRRLNGELALFEQYIVPEQQAAVVELVQSVDQLIVANEVLAGAVNEQFGAASAELINRPGVANIIGVFSRDVDILGEKIDGDRAVVTFQVARRIPLDTAVLVLRDGRWLIQTDAPVEGVSRQLQKLAELLTDMARGVRARKYDAESLRSELAAREAPIGRRLAELSSATEP